MEINLEGKTMRRHGVYEIRIRHGIQIERTLDLEVQRRGSLARAALSPD